MATRYLRVNPGDLIKATFVNSLLDALEKLEDRVTFLEQIPSDAVFITSITSSGVLVTSPIELGKRIEINGGGFTTPGVLNQVLIGGLPPMEIKGGSSATQLIVDIPIIPGIPEGGASVPVVVKNLKGSVGSTSLLVKPNVVIPSGDLFVTYAKAPIMAMGHLNIESSSPTTSYIFSFNIRAVADLPGKYRVTATSSTPSWAVEVLEETSDVPRATNVVSLSASGTQDVRVRVTVPSGLGAAAGTTITFASSESSVGTKMFGQALINLAVGSPPPQPDTRVRVALGPVQGGAKLVGARIMFARTKTGAVTFNFAIAEAGKYEVTTAMRGVGQPGPDTWQFISQNVSQIVASGPITTDISVAWKANTNAAATDLIVSIRRADANPPLSIDYAQPVGVTDV